MVLINNTKRIEKREKGVAWTNNSVDIQRRM